MHTQHLFLVLFERTERDDRIYLSLYHDMFKLVNVYKRKYVDHHVRRTYDIKILLQCFLMYLTFARPRRDPLISGSCVSVVIGFRMCPIVRGT